jgi:hypothetical protein
VYNEDLVKLELREQKERVRAQGAQLAQKR